MVVLTTLNIIVVLLSYFAKDGRYRYLLAWAFALLIIVTGIRYDVGSDYLAYKFYFDHGYPSVGDVESVEYGWKILNILFQPFGFPALVFFLSCIENVLLFFILRRFVNPRWYWLAVALYVFNANYMIVGLSMMRQFLIQIFALYAIYFAANRKLLFFIAISLLSFSIHKVSILFLPIYLVPFISEHKKIAITLFLLVFIYLYNNIDFLVENMTSFLVEGNLKFADYLNEDDLGGKLGLKLFLHYGAFTILFFRNIDSVDKNYRIFPWVVVMGMLIIPFMVIHVMILRLSWVYTMAEIIAMPILINNEKTPIVRYGALFALFFALWFEYIEFINSDIYAPYFGQFKTIIFN